MKRLQNINFYGEKKKRKKTICFDPDGWDLSNVENKSQVFRSRKKY